MALFECVVKGGLFEVNFARFPKTFLAFLFLAAKNTDIDTIFAVTNF